MSTSSMAGPGTWDLRFSRMNDSVEPVITEVWRLECRDPATWVQSIPLFLKFTNRSHMMTWLSRTFMTDITESHKDWFEGKVDSEIAGHVIHDLYALARRHDSDSSPWFYSSYFGPQTQLVEVLDDGGYQLYPPTADAAVEEEPESEVDKEIWELTAYSESDTTGPIDDVLFENALGFFRRVNGIWEISSLEVGVDKFVTVIRRELAKEFLVEFDKGGMTVEVADTFQIVDEPDR